MAAVEPGALGQSPLGFGIGFEQIGGGEGDFEGAFGRFPAFGVAAGSSHEGGIETDIYG